MRRPWPEFIGYIRHDKNECIGPERAEWNDAVRAMFAGIAAGASSIDPWTFLELNPYCKAQRPLRTEAQLWAIIDGQSFPKKDKTCEQ